jgi:hypothetical protein
MIDAVALVATLLALAPAKAGDAPAKTGTAPDGRPLAADKAPVPTVDQPPPALEELVRRAVAAQSKKPQRLSCKVETRAWLLDSSGQPKEEQLLERSESWTSGTASLGPLTKVVADGKPLSEKELAEANLQEAQKQADLDERQKKGEGQELRPVFAAESVAQTSFTLAREEQLAGRRAWVLSFAPKPGARDGRAGTAWLDAETGLALKVTSSPSPLPSHVDAMELDEEQQLTAAGEVAPLRTRIDSSGGILFLKRHFRLETKWIDCR